MFVSFPAALKSGRAAAGPEWYLHESLYVYIYDDGCVKMTAMRSVDKLLLDMKLKKVNLFLAVAHMTELRRISRESLIPVSALIRKAIAEFIERHKKAKSKGAT
ncbi:MAG TPA: hypothetical protein VG322_06905 [Candidatus Acidoferrales bacterium]|nr:hypothetical protein [Candidatus Acidoferrales bacterium]